MIPLALLACSDYAVEHSAPEASVDPPALTLSPASVDLGLVAHGEPARATFALGAVGSVTLDQVTVSGPGFTLPVDWTGASLDDQVVDLEVVFTSDATGPQEGRRDVWSAAAVVVERPRRRVLQVGVIPLALVSCSDDTVASGPRA